MTIIDERPASITLLVGGQNAWSFFSSESGGHRWQRVPPNERHGKVQTSTVTVAVLPAVPVGSFSLRESDLDWDKPFCAGGPGGQHQNKTASACRVRHKPSGIVVECRTERSLHQNRRYALDLLASRVKASDDERRHGARGDARRAQIGTGMRGDKIRTYREKDDLVVDERTGKKGHLSKLQRGDWSEVK